MENNYYKQLFSLYSGYAYEFLGNIPDNESAFEYITKEFVKESGKGEIHTNVIQLNNGKYVIHSFENLESEKFIQVSDLSYQPPVLPDPEPEPESEQQSETGEQQETQGGQ